MQDSIPNKNEKLYINASQMNHSIIFCKEVKYDLIFPFQSYVIDKHQSTLLYAADDILHVKVPFLQSFQILAIQGFCTLNSFHFAMLHENLELTKIR